MIDGSVSVESAVSEYHSVVNAPTLRVAEKMDSEQLVRDMCRSHGWTEHGARAIVTLANDYGVFMLRNALALAVALNKEDGDLGF